MKQTSISDYLKKYHIKDNLCLLIEEIAKACGDISFNISQEEILKNSNLTDSTNIQGEKQHKLDILANNIIIKNSGLKKYVSGFLSEEMEFIQEIPEKNEFVLSFDPMDGSSNIDVNTSIGTIFSVLPYKENQPLENSFLQKGRNQIAAGYVIYGPKIMLILTVGFGVVIFQLDKKSNNWILIQENIEIPKDANEFAINTSNYYHWKDSIRDCINEMLKGEDGKYKKYYNMRWNASFVSEIQRILIRGGIFMYPWDKRRPKRNGHLRLLYEANPMAMIVEQAKGKATNGNVDILDIQPENIHERVEIFCGSINEVDKIKSYLN